MNGRLSLIGAVTTAHLAFGVGAANANLVAALDAVTATAGGFDWQYRVTLASDQNLKSGDPAGPSFFTIYDFGSTHVINSTLPNTWAFTNNLFDPPAAGTTPIPPDNPSIANARFTYQGPTIIGPGTSPWLVDLFSTVGLGRSGATDGQAFNKTTGDLQRNSGTTTVPVPGPILGTGLPGLVAACSGLLALARRRRNRTNTI